MARKSKRDLDWHNVRFTPHATDEEDIVNYPNLLA